MVTTQALANVFDHFDRNLLNPYAVGFDRMFDRLNDHYALHQTNTGFPPYNIRKEGDYNFVIELALAGLTKEDLEVEVVEGTLVVRSVEKKKEEGGADDVVVKDAKMENGMLLIDLERVVPEEKKPRTIKIK